MPIRPGARAAAARLDAEQVVEQRDGEVVVEVRVAVADDERHDREPPRRLVAEDAATGAVHERVDHVVRKAVRVGRHRGRRDDAHQLPVAGRRVLALRPLEQPAGDRRRARLRRAALELLHVSEAERLQVRKIEATDRLGDVAEHPGHRVRHLSPEGEVQIEGGAVREVDVVVKVSPDRAAGQSGGGSEDEGVAAEESSGGPSGSSARCSV